MENKIGEMLLEQQKRDLGYQKEVSDLFKQLEREKKKADTMSQEVSCLRQELKDSRSLFEQQTTMMQEHEASVTKSEEFITQLTIQRDEHIEQIKQLTALHATDANPPHQTLPSPETSTTNSQTTSQTISPSPASTEARRLDNIRQTYTKVKRRYDSLHSVCVKLSTCTDSWVLNSFGDFGQMLKLLRQALDEDGEERRAVAGQAKRAGKKG